MGRQVELNNPIRLIELFAGVGTQAMAFRDLGAKFERYRVIEHDKFAMRSYNVIHGTDFSCKEIEDVKGRDLGIVATDKYDYVMTYSFPCFTADTLVLTEKGYKRIVDVRKGDKVLTHNNLYKEVQVSRCTGIKNTMKLKAACLDEVSSTPEHRFYVRKRENKQCGKPEWLQCKELSRQHLLGIAVNQRHSIPTWTGIKAEVMRDSDFWFLVGRLMRCNEDKVLSDYRADCIMYGLDIKFRTDVTGRVLCNKAYQRFMEQFYKGVIPSFVFDLPSKLCKSFIEGYMRTEKFNEKGVCRLMSNSREFIYSLAQIVVKAYKRPYRLYCNRVDIREVKGKCKKQNKSYALCWSLQSAKGDLDFYENGYIWSPVHRVYEEHGKHRVYDLTVKDDHSFTANGVIVHNCTDLSPSGKMLGMEKGSGTRSGLLWEVERLLNEVTELPQVLIMENVPQVHSQVKHGKRSNADCFEDWKQFLESKGYTNFCADLQAKDFNIPQSRNRCYMVSILGKGVEYEFPKGVALQRDIKEYLLNNVEDNWYMQQKRADELLQPLRDSGKIDDYVYPVIAAMRGRNKENPSDRRAGIDLEQRLEINVDGLCNTLTLVQKDNMVIEKTNKGYRVRRLVPQETWSFMGYSMYDFELAKGVNSNTQLIRQAGNGIVRDVFTAIVSQLHIQGLTSWNERLEM
jgi:DNA (cytosine-5)-methyltransferase 1